MTRSQHVRQPPLQHVRPDRLQTFVVGGDEDTNSQPEVTVYAAPNWLVFIEGLWHGDYQQIPVEPESLDELIAALEKAKAVHAETIAEAPQR